MQGFFFSILLGSHTSDYPQEELAKFGYRSERKMEKCKNPTKILATYLNLLYKYDNFGTKIPPNLVTLVNFFTKNL
jgi:hypothetical protein